MNEHVVFSVFVVVVVVVVLFVTENMLPADTSTNE
jgi:hypothetical protein